jgi:hypothetical protein
VSSALKARSAPSLRGVTVTTIKRSHLFRAFLGARGSRCLGSTWCKDDDIFKI